MHNEAFGCYISRAFMWLSCGTAITIATHVTGSGGYLWFFLIPVLVEYSNHNRRDDGKDK